MRSKASPIGDAGRMKLVPGTGFTTNLTSRRRRLSSTTPVHTHQKFQRRLEICRLPAVGAATIPVCPLFSLNGRSLMGSSPARLTNQASFALINADGTRSQKSESRMAAAGSPRHAAWGHPARISTTKRTSGTGIDRLSQGCFNHGLPRRSHQLQPPRGSSTINRS
jgi:hypothetical protein